MTTAVCRPISVIAATIMVIASSTPDIARAVDSNASASADAGAVASQKCVEAPYVLSTLEVIQTDDDNLVSVADLPAGDDLVFHNSYSVSGPCAEFAEVYNGGLLRFSTGVTIKIDNRSVPSIERSNPRQFGKYQALTANDKLPAFDGRMFVKALEIRSFKSGKDGAYLGLWTEPGKPDMLASFVIENGRSTSPQPFLTSTKAILNSAYLPSPDSKAGALSLVQSDGDKRNLIVYTWINGSLKR